MVISVERAGDNNSTSYLASSLITPGGNDKDTVILKSYALKYKTTVMAVNHGRDSGGFTSTDKSEIWNPRGELIGQPVTVQEKDFSLQHGLTENRSDQIIYGVKTPGEFAVANLFQSAVNGVEFNPILIPQSGTKAF
jgi:hypothetical protein